MKVKLLFVLLAVVCLTLAVGIGVHLMHKDALAIEHITFSAFLTDEVELIVNNEDIEIHAVLHKSDHEEIDGGFEVVFLSFLAGYQALVSYTSSEVHHWEVWIDNGADPVLPVDRHCRSFEENHVDWIVDPW